MSAPIMNRPSAFDATRAGCRVPNAREQWGLTLCPGRRRSDRATQPPATRKSAGGWKRTCLELALLLRVAAHLCALSGGSRGLRHLPSDPGHRPWRCLPTDRCRFIKVVE